ncbi:hypothetical protein OAB97_01425 [Candidatus Pelagibacter sp.]|nr:hypothetical protein [Candidatus Pelagibacter sp.]
MKNINIQKTFLIFIIINIFLVIFYLFEKHNVGNDSSISEWLINYQGGFTRRGLGGEIAIFFAKFLTITLRESIFIIQTFVHISYLTLIYLYLKDLKLNLIQLFALYTPIFLLYPIAEIEALGRKEILLFLFLVSLIFFSFKRFNKNIINTQVFLMTPFVCLIWEQIVLFFPFIAVILIFKNELKNFQETFKKLFIIFFPSILIFAYIFFTPLSPEGHEVMCKYNVNEFGEKCYMSASMLITSTIHFDTLWIHDNASFIHYFRYIVIFIIGFLPLNILIFKNNFKEKNNFITKNFKLSTLFFILYSPSLLLFMFGYDWGRWINITYTFSILLYFYLLNNSLITNNGEFGNLIWKKIIKKKSIICLIFFIFAFFWNPKTVITADIATNTGYKIIYNTSKIVFNFGSIRLFQDNILIKFHKKYIE